MEGQDEDAATNICACSLHKVPNPNQNLLLHGTVEVVLPKASFASLLANHNIAIGSVDRECYMLYMCDL